VEEKMGAVEEMEGEVLTMGAGCCVKGRGRGKGGGGEPLRRERIEMDEASDVPGVRGG
jgi:hypothetical protein